MIISQTPYRVSFAGGGTDLPAFWARPAPSTANMDLADDVDEVVVIYADNFSDIDLRPLIAFHHQHTDPLTMVLFQALQSWCLWDRRVGQGRANHLLRREAELPASSLANTTGLYVIDAAAYREIAKMKAFDLGFEVLPRFVRSDGAGHGAAITLTLRTHESLLAFKRDARISF